MITFIHSAEILKQTLTGVLHIMFTENFFRKHQRSFCSKTAGQQLQEKRLRRYFFFFFHNTIILEDLQVTAFKKTFLFE